MGIALFLLELLATVVEEVWMFYIPVACFGKDRNISNKKTAWIVIAIGSALTMFLNQFKQTSAYSGLIIMIYAIVCLSIILEINVIEAISCVGSYIFFLITSGTIDVMITGWIGGESLIRACTQEKGIHRFWYLLIFGIFWNGIVFLGIRWLKDTGKKWRTNKVQAAVFSMIGIVGFSAFFEQILTIFNQNLGWQGIALLLIAVFLFFIYYYHEKRKNWLFEKEQFEKDNIRMENSYRSIQNYYEDNAKLYHDFKNHLMVLKKLNDERKHEEIDRYISSIIQEQTKYRKHIWTGIDIIDIVISEKQMIGEEKGLNVKMDIAMLPSSFPLQGRECCSLFANLFDNAIESAKSVIWLTVKTIEDTCAICIKNDLKKALKKGRNRPFSKKDDTKLHGFGLRNVEDIVSRYSGNISYEYDEDYFIVQICFLCIVNSRISD